jgi:hypothetical protein
VGEPAPADSEPTILWTLELPGSRPAELAATRDASAVLVSDGWGVAYRSLTLRRLNLRDGSLEAKRRIGDSGRCFAFDVSGENFIAAFDKRLRLMRTDSLEELEVWDRRVPRYANAIVWAGRRVLLRNDARANVFDLDSGTTRRFTLGEIGGDLLHQRPDGKVVAGGVRGEQGTVWEFESLDTRPRPVIATPSLHSIAVDHDGSIWAAVGNAHIETTDWHGEQGQVRVGIASVKPGPPARELRRYDPRRPDPFILKTRRPFRVISVGRGELWLAGDQHHERELAVIERLRLHDLKWLPALYGPRRHWVTAMLPQAGVAFSRRALDGERYELACLAAVA